MARFELEPGEELRVEDTDAGWYKSKWMLHSGRLIITNRRIVFEERRRYTLGWLLEDFATRIVFKMMNDTVKSCLKQNQGYNLEVVFVDKFDQQWRFLVKKQDEIIEKMESLITWG